MPNRYRISFVCLRVLDELDVWLGDHLEEVADVLAVDVGNQLLEDLVDGCPQELRGFCEETDEDID